MAPGPGRMGAGAGGGIPSVPSRGAGLGFPGPPGGGGGLSQLPPLTFLRLLRNMRGLAPRPPGPGCALRPSAPQWVGPWAFHCAGEDACLRSWGCSATASSHRQAAVFCSSSLLPHLRHRHKQGGSLMRKHRNVFCALTTGGGWRGAWRGLIHTVSQFRWLKLLIMRTRAA